MVVAELPTEAARMGVADGDLMASSDDELTSALAESAEHHHREIEQLKAQYEAMLVHVRSSFSYRLGDTILDLASRSGRRRFPKRFLALVKEVRSRRRGGPGAASTVSLLPEVPPRRSTSVVSILDEFSHACLAPELKLTPASPGVLSSVGEADLLFAETAWNGNGGQWAYAFSNFGKSEALPELLATAKRLEVASVLWNKEDPASFDLFLPVAREFDHVVTTDVECVPRYRSQLGHDRVHTMMFAAQPAIHNPIGRPSEPAADSCFAGAWRGHKYPERGRDLAMILDGALRAGPLVIFDREAATGSDPSASFPPRFQSLIAGSLPYDQMVAEYRRHAVFLNANAIVRSPSMLSRRVFEILASRTPVVSSNSAAIETHLADVVFTPATVEEAAETVGELLHDRDLRDRVGQRGYRLVHREHTYERRVAALLEDIGLETPTTSTPSVDVICVSDRPHQVEHVFANFERQVNVDASLVFVTNADGFDIDGLRNRIEAVPGSRLLVLPADLTLGECMNEAISGCTGTHWAKFDDDDLYGAHYLEDQMLAVGYSGAAVVGKRTFHAYVESADSTVVRNEGHEFASTSYVMGGTIVADRNAVGPISWRALPSGSDSVFLRSCRDAGLSIFSTDRFNYLMERRASGDHTWTVADHDFLRNCRKIASGRADQLVCI